MAFGIIVGASHPTEPTPRMLMLKVTDRAGLANHTLQRARCQVSRIYRDAGVNTVWIGGEVEPPPGSPATVAEVVVLEEAPARDVAHELGHLLLADDGHSSNGLLHESFDFSDRAPLRLTRGEIARIHGGFATRMGGAAP
jgi:hypothetical protein